MSKFIALTASFMLAMSAVAGEPVKVQKEVVCDEASVMLPYIKEKYNEVPIFLGEVKSKDGSASFSGVLINPETQTWTILLFNEKISCIIESGTGFKIQPPK